MVYVLKVGTASSLSLLRLADADPLVSAFFRSCCFVQQKNNKGIKIKIRFLTVQLVFDKINEI